MEIILLRHGRPSIGYGRPMSAAEFGRWVVAYNAAGIDPGVPPPPQAMEAARQCAFVLCSTLPRSSASARALGVTRIDACDALFREMEMPSASWPFPRLSARAWAVIFRLLWMAGFSANAESFPAARARARHCAEQLVALAAEHGKVLFVGHGSLNWFIARHLERMGWQGPRHAPRRYWELGRYHPPQTSNG